jgi:hypothetical protein
LRLATIPLATGAEPVVKTIGMAWVAAFNSGTAMTLSPVTKMTATLRPTRSATSAGSRSSWLSAQRDSIVTFRPSANPLSLRPRRNSSMRSAHSAGDGVMSAPITGIAGCCARAATGQAAAPPRRPIMSRRFIR